MQVCNLTNAANYFHACGGRCGGGFRKPLVIVTPKSLLRAKEVMSRWPIWGRAPRSTASSARPRRSRRMTRWRRVRAVERQGVFRLVKARAEKGDKSVALVRLEQLYPFPFETLADVLRRYPRAEIVWCQRSRRIWAPGALSTAASSGFGRARYRCQAAAFCRRAEAASPGDGPLQAHQHEQAQLVEDALAA